MPFLNTPLLESKLSELLRFTAELEAVTRHSFEEYIGDFRNTRTAERDVELLIELGTDILAHILLSRGVPPPKSYRDAFSRGAEEKIISRELSESLAAIASLRNRLLHDYDGTFDQKTAYETFRSSPKHFRLFAETIFRLLEQENEGV